MTRIQRVLANLFEGWFQMHRRFPVPVLDAMADAISVGEHSHLGEVRFAIESRLGFLAVLSGLDAPTQAQHVFTHLRVWDTEHNCGVLLYLLMAEHRIEIVADRGIARRVTAAEWEVVCERMRQHFGQDEWQQGALQGIAETHELLARHFPSHGKRRADELPDRPVLL